MDLMVRPCQRRSGQKEPATSEHRANKQPKMSIHCKSLLLARSVPVFFILVCFLIIANSRCDQVGSTTVSDEMTSENSGGSGETAYKLKSVDLASLSSKDLEALKQQATATKIQRKQAQNAHKLDPLSMLREIYLDHNSKVITMLMPDSETVQKFHPNGRYGRRSNDNLVEPHAELGKLVYDNNEVSRLLAPTISQGRASDTSTLRAILRSIGRGNTASSAAEAAASAVATAHARSAPSKYSGRPTPANLFVSNGAQVANYQLEMNKLLKCNYTGISNLYWCDTTTSAT